MLPSTGYFKGINCPFYDSGLCERPYCHFRHVKKESQGICSDGIESGAILQKLVSAAVQKVLQQTENSGLASPIHANVVDIVSGPIVSAKATYNPTPISELNKIINSENDNNDDKNEQKKHIPIPYTPRKPTSLPIKRAIDTNGANIFTYIPPAKYSPGSESAQLDPYTPKGTIELSEKYLPGTEKPLQEYTIESQVPNKHNYVPSDKTASKKKLLEYKPIKVVAKSEQPLVTYQPTPRSLVPCFSSDEEEPEIKKRKLSSDLNGLDDLGPEFDILDQILDEEQKDKDLKCKSIKENIKDNKVIIDHGKQDLRSKNKCKKVNKITLLDSENSKSDSIKELKKVNKDEERHRKHSKSKISDKKSSHKKTSKEKDERKEKHERKSLSHSKTSNDHSKNSKNSLKSDKSKHSSSKNEKKNNSRESKEKHKKQNVQKHKEIKTIDEDSNSYEGHMDADINNFSESDEETIAEECKRIFEEYVPTEKSLTSDEPNNKKELSDEDYIIPSKKRVSRTIDKDVKILRKPAAKPDYRVCAAQAMAERQAKVREFHAAKKSKNCSITNMISKPDVVKNYFSASANGNSKVRIAHVPYASTLLTAKKIITPNLNEIKNIEPSTSSTSIQTVKKGTQRVAHIPNEKFIDRPGVLEPLASKIPANIRSTYLNIMIDHCLNIYIAAVDAYARAQHEELATSKKCSTVPIYKNSAVLTISRLKKEVVECNGMKKSGSECISLNKIPQTVSNKTSSVGSWSIESKNKKNYDDCQQYTGSKLYKNILKWVLTGDQLKENGFPRPHESGEKGRAIIYGQNKQKPPKGFIRTCCRCKKDYTVNKKGFPAIKEECIYHPNNKYRVRGEVRYQCCSQDGSSDGCCIASNHVYEYVDYENLKGYIKTLPSDTIKDDYGVYSLDCEMCYTTQGLDLTRVTVIDSACKVVYETLVRPLHPIIDYNTRYSGITEEQMTEVKTTLLDVQATLLTMFNSKTILIGHSLESDFKALKLIHETVIDTSVLFPHKMGPPYKRALRNLSSEYLKKIIQNSVDGHDSAEDATVCMELLVYKLKEDLKTR